MKLILYLLAIMWLSFLLQNTLHGFTEELKLDSSKVWERPYLLITSAFLHGDIVHLLYNSVGLFLFGSILLNIIGPKNFLAIYFASAIAAGICASLFYPYSLGASGAIFGLIGALAILRPFMTIYAYYLPLPMIVAAAVWTIGDLVGLLIPSNVAHAAHLAGLALGIAAGLILAGRYSEQKIKGAENAVSQAEFEEWEQKYMR